MGEFEQGHRLPFGSETHVRDHQVESMIRLLTCMASSRVGDSTRIETFPLGGKRLLASRSMAGNRKAAVFPDILFRTKFPMKKMITTYRSLFLPGRGDLPRTGRANNSSG
jgi:hypothetical protein